MKQIHFESLDSTNAYLKDNYETLEDLTFVSCNKQTQGRGRNDRIWQSDDNNLLFSLLIKDKRLFCQNKTISILSAYSVLQVLKEYGINDVSIKWPNDVYVGDKKICGILLQAISKKELDCLIIGIGINVNQKTFNEEYHATSISCVLGKDIDLSKFKQDIYIKLAEDLDKLLNGYDYYQEIIKYDYLRNKEAYALINNERKLIKVKGINKDYTLCVISNESEYNLNSGEISFHI